MPQLARGGRAATPLPPCRFQLPDHSVQGAAASAAGQSSAAVPTLQLNINDTSLTLPMPVAAAENLRSELRQLLVTFAEKAKAERPRRWPSMEYVLENASGPGVEYFEVFCNANAYDTPFNAKVLVSLRHEGLKLTTEAKLYNFKADIDTFLQDAGVDA
mmetsp:Transcript_23735/g.70415  ORF Transcript_23735/g.70415 Transcript_23735/m.70415 type:complete len:159 (-) Transcript_23735:95-571(-)